jgi:glycosyltransferase involved in cell wall biosynthesis
MLAGRPVIASDFPLWKEIIKTCDCGLTVDPKNPTEIAKAIEFILSNNDKAEQMGKNGRKAVLSTYNWDAEGEKLVSVYRSFFS